MANSRNSPPRDLASRVRAELVALIPGGDRVAIALSGGVDSMVLLDLLHGFAAFASIELQAIHVNHGLSPNASAWEAFCRHECAKRGIPIVVHALKLARAPQESLEAIARTARYTALMSTACEWLLLAHHQDDQAETLLLQVLRGAGPRGLSAMPPVHPSSAAGAPTIIRPLLETTRVEIVRHAQERQLSWIEDESNSALAHRRNALRIDVIPALRRHFAGYPRTLARAARHQADACDLADDLAAIDAMSIVRDEAIALDAFRALSPARQRNLLRYVLKRYAPLMPPEARLEAMRDQLVNARRDARVTLAHGEWLLGCHRGMARFYRASPRSFETDWSGESEIVLAHGTLKFVRGGGSDSTRSTRFRIDRGQRLRVAPRVGGEHIQLASNRPRQSLKMLFQQSGLAPWERQALPLLWHGDALVAVPCIGVALDWQAAENEPGWSVAWEPAWP